jgi:hypothetical protein
MDREEVIEAAMLANFVGSHLQGIDKLAMERTSRPANKINMEVFTAPLVGKRVRPPVVEEATPDVVKAYAGLNELAVNSVPDISNDGAPSISTAFPSVPSTLSAKPQPQRPVAPQTPLAGATSEDIEFIKKQLVQINTNLTKLAGMAGKLFASVSTQPSNRKNSGK